MFWLGGPAQAPITINLPDPAVPYKEPGSDIELWIMVGSAIVVPLLGLLVRLYLKK